MLRSRDELCDSAMFKMFRARLRGRLPYPNDGELDGKDMDSEIESGCVYTYMGTYRI